MKHTIFITSLLAAGLSHGAGILIDVTWPDGTGTGDTFNQIDNNYGGEGGGTGAAWVQSTGVVNRGDVDDPLDHLNLAVGASSDAIIDFTDLGSDSLVLTATVFSASGTLGFNGLFIGFQDGAGGDGTSLWNGDGPAFGLVIAGTKYNGQNYAAPGGNWGPTNDHPFQNAPTDARFGVVTDASMNDGFGLKLTIGSAGWDLVLTGLEDSGAAAIGGGSGTWADSDITWAQLTASSTMHAAFSTQGGAGDLTMGSLNVTQIPEPSSCIPLGFIGLAFILRRRK